LSHFSNGSKGYLALGLTNARSDKAKLLQL